MPPINNKNKTKADITSFIEALLKPEAYPHHVEQVTLMETHISWVFLTGRYAYKIKKAINLGFYEAKKLQQRIRFCEEELRLNRRLSPELYIGLVSILGPHNEAKVSGRNFNSHST